MDKLSTFVINTMKYHYFINITEKVEELVAASGVKNGTAFVITAHTTTGITVNESLECLQSDMDELMNRLVPEHAPYSHARMLHTYGQQAGNPTGHLKAMLTGNHIVFPVRDGKMVRGREQYIFFCEYDGPQDRTVFVQVTGE